MENIAMTQTIIPKADCKSLLVTLKDAIEDFEYITPVMFSGVVSAGVLGYLRGKGHKLDGTRKTKERISILENSIDNLVEFSLDNDDFGWFLDKLDKIQEAYEERGLMTE